MNFKDKASYQISVLIANDKEVLNLNKKFRGIDETTDVLSFDNNDKLGDNEYNLGDIIVNRDQATRQAKEYGNSIEEEISELVAHGVLHLLGIHHKGDEN